MGRPRTGTTVTCALCGSEKYKHPSWMNKSKNNRFCSMDCYSEYRKQNAKQNTYVQYHRLAEHRLVCERAMGCSLGPDDIVHHINENRRDNRPDNLCVVTRGQHQAIHARLRKDRREGRL
jgi:hypothetical protein